MNLFPANNIWNIAVDQLPLVADSDTLINSIQTLDTRYGTDPFLRLDDALPINYVPGDQLKVRIDYGGNTESDPGPYPIPFDAVTEAGSDVHVLVVDVDNHCLYELFAANRLPDGSWTCGSSAKWDLRSNALRPLTWTSADAAGLPIAPGVLRYEEMVAGEVAHALRFTAPKTRATWDPSGYLWPARHYAAPGTQQGPEYPRMGLRVRLKSSFDVAPFPAHVQTILRGLKKYGAMLADNGMPWGMQHDGSSEWSSLDMLPLHNISGYNMEVVDSAALMVDVNSGATGDVSNRVFVTDAFGRQDARPLPELLPPPLDFPSQGKISAYVLPAGSNVASSWGWVTLDAPLTLTKDANGRYHIGVAK